MEQQRKCLNVCAQKLSLGLVWRELQVFSKLIFRGRNQHRRDKCYQRLTRVSKDLRVYQEVALANHTKKLVKMFLSSDSITHSIKTQGAVLASKLIESAKFIIRLLEFITDTFREVEQRLQMSLFIPFNLLMASSLSRIWYCLRYHLLAIAETYRVVKEILLSSSTEFLPSLDAYLSKVQTRMYLNTPIDQFARRMDDLGKAVKRTRPTMLATAPENNMKTELSEIDTVLDLPNQTEAHSQPICITDRDSFNETTGSIDKDPSSVRAAPGDKAKSTGRERCKTRRRKQANTLSFQFKSRQKPVKVLLRGKKLLALLSNKNMSVAGAKISHLRLLPSGSLVASKFTISLVCLQCRPDQQRHSAMRGGHRVSYHSQWMETERTRLSQRKDAPITHVHHLQQKLTQELDNAATVDADAESDLHFEYSQSDSQLSVTNKQKCTKQEINRTSIPDEIDDIFGALDD